MHRPLLASLLTFAVAATAAAQDGTVVYRGARLFTGDGPVIEHAVLVVAGGKVQNVGTDSLPIPDGAEVVDVSGCTITPGLVDASWSGALPPNDQNEQSDEVTPCLHVLDGLDPASPAFLRTRSQGVTTVHVMPGTRNVIGGMSAVIKTWGKDPASMVLKDEAALRMVLGAEPSMGNMAIGGSEPDSTYYRRPTTRMGVIWAVRKHFYAAKDYLARTIDPAAAANAPTSDTQTERELAVLARVLQGKLPVMTTARSEQDLRTALRLAAEFGYTPIVDEAQDAYLVTQELKQARVTVVASAPSQDRVAGTGSADGAEPRAATLLRLRDAGVPFAIATGSNLAALDLVREATFAHRFGLTAQEAIAAVTSAPARLLGIADRTGTLAPGKDADFVVWTTDPLDPAAQAQTVVVSGSKTPVLR